MPNLVWKDLIAARTLILLIVPLGVLQVTTFALAGPLFLLGSLILTGILAFGSVALEEIQGTELLWNSLPVARWQIVVARYLTVLLGIFAGLALSWSGGWAVSRIAVHAGGVSAAIVGLRAHAMLAAMLLLAAAVFLPLHFKYGAGRGLMIFSAVSVGLLLVLSVLGQVILLAKGISSPLFDPETWRTAGPELRDKLAAWLVPRIVLILGLLVSFSLAAFAFSALVSRRLYESRDL